MENRPAAFGVNTAKPDVSRRQQPGQEPPGGMSGSLIEARACPPLPQIALLEAEVSYSIVRNM
jgi:hypothetical protein